MKSIYDLRLDKEIAYFAPKLKAYQKEAGISDTELGKLERNMRPLVKRLTLLRAISHSTDKDQSDAAKMYRDFLLLEARRTYKEYLELKKEYLEYEEFIHKVNHDFVEDINSAPLY